MPARDASRHNVTPDLIQYARAHAPINTRAQFVRSSFIVTSGTLSSPRVVPSVMARQEASNVPNANARRANATASAARRIRLYMPEIGREEVRVHDHRQHCDAKKYKKTKQNKKQKKKINSVPR
jgi:hypothetical protein